MANLAPYSCVSGPKKKTKRFLCVIKREVREKLADVSFVLKPVDYLLPFTADI